MNPTPTNDQAPDQPDQPYRLASLRRVPTLPDQNQNQKRYQEQNPDQKCQPRMEYLVTITTDPCLMCGESSEITVRESEWRRYYLNRELVQNVFPTWTPDRRELLMTGTHPECWKEMFPEENEEEEE